MLDRSRLAWALGTDPSLAKLKSAQLACGRMSAL